MSEEEKQIRKLFQETLREEIDWGELRKEKAAFIREHFAPKPRVFFPRHVMVPALSFCLVLGLVFIVMPGRAVKQAPAPAAGEAKPAVQTASLMSASAPATEASEDSPAALLTEDEYEPAPVSVSQLKSDVGTPMVYQRTVDNVPVVVIWVFPGK